MRNSKKLLILGSFLGLISCTETGTTPAQYYDIPADRISVLQKEAIDGNGEAAWQLAHYYTFSKPDKNKTLYWYKISANDGYAPGMYGYGSFLEMKADPESKKQARYWFKKAKTSSDPRVSSLAADHLERLESGQQ